MPKPPSFQRLAVIGAILMLVVSSFLASVLYHDYKQVAQEKDKLNHLIESADNRERQLAQSLLSVFEDRVKKSFLDDADAKLLELEKVSPTFGQCTIAVLIMEHFFGGEILEAEIPEKWYDATWFYSHFWNKIGGQNIDLTKEQFPPVFPYDDLINGRLGRTRIVSREEILSDEEVAKNYKQAMERLEKILF